MSASAILSACRAWQWAEIGAPSKREARSAPAPGLRAPGRRGPASVGEGGAVADEDGNVRVFLGFCREVGAKAAHFYMPVREDDGPKPAFSSVRSTPYSRVDSIWAETKDCVLHYQRPGWTDEKRTHFVDFRKAPADSRQCEFAGYFRSASLGMGSASQPSRPHFNRRRRGRRPRWRRPLIKARAGSRRKPSDPRNAFRDLLIRSASHESGFLCLMALHRRAIAKKIKNNKMCGPFEHHAYPSVIAADQQLWRRRHGGRCRMNRALQTSFWARSERGPGQQFWSAG